MFGLGAGELFLIFIIALLFLGPKKLPELAKGLGQAMREFQKARDEMMNEVNKPHPEVKTEVKKDVEVTATKLETNEPNSSESPKQS
jgi:TatA/E family protein of Tat protein translocase